MAAGPRVESARVRRLGARLGEVEGERHEALRTRIYPVEHHPAHLASGDFVSASWAIGRGSRLLALDRIHFPHSLGLLYLAVTQYLGFPRYGDEQKVMGAGGVRRARLCPVRQLLRLSPGGKSCSTTRTSGTAPRGRARPGRTLLGQVCSQPRATARAGAPAR